MTVPIASDLSDIARTVNMEAGGESYTGKLAVAWVIRNRHVNYVQSYQDVIYRAYQFSCWNTDSPTRLNLDENTAQWTDSLKAACAAYFGLSHDVTHGATMYANLNVCSPNWDFSQLTKTAEIGNHTFYKEK